MLLEYNTRIVQNRVGSWQKQQYQYSIHTLSSRVTKKLLNTFIVARSKLVQNSDGIMLPETQIIH